MKPKRTLRHVLAAIGCAAFAISSALATDGTWDQTGTGNPYNWSDTGSENHALSGHGKSDK